MNLARMRRAMATLLTVLGLIAPVVFSATQEASAFSPAEVYRNASTSVVLIFGFSDSGAGSSGTGSIITADGLVLTNNHVIADGKSGKLFPNLVVYFKPARISGDNRKDLVTPFLVDVVARDPDLDLALLRVKNPPPNLRPVEVGDSEEVDIGEPVAAIGHPGGGGLWTLTTGTISSKRKDKARDIFQTDTAINPGNSGGPLLDENARLVGINTFVRRTNEQGLPLEGLNYSLRSALALAWVNQQGVSRVSAVSRATTLAAAEPAPAPTPTAPTAPPTPAPDVKPAPAPAPAPAPKAPEIESAPSPVPTPPAVTREERRPPPPPPEPEAREFKGPKGETMYGVPNPDVDLHEALVEARKKYEKLYKRVDESVNEMDRMIDDYDNF